MPLKAGKVSLLLDGTCSGNGLARELFDGLVAANESLSSMYGWRLIFANISNSCANAIVKHITENADVVVDKKSLHGVVK